MSAIPPITGSTPPKPEQVEALVAALSKLLTEQTAMDLHAAIVSIPASNLVRIVHAVHLGWEARRNGGEFVVRVGRSGDPKRAATIEVEMSTPIP